MRVTLVQQYFERDTGGQCQRANQHPYHDRRRSFWLRRRRSDGKLIDDVAAQDAIENNPRFPDVAKPGSYLFVETSTQQFDDRFRRIFWQRVPIGLRTQDSRQRVRQRGAVEALFCRQHFKKNTPEPEYVGTLIDLLSACLFGAHVSRSSEDDSGGGRTARHHRR